MTGRWKVALVLCGVCAAVAMVAVTGTALTAKPDSVATTARLASAGVTADMAQPSPTTPGAKDAAAGGAAPTGPSSTGAQPPAAAASAEPASQSTVDPQRMVVTTASMDIRVSALDQAVERVRLLTTAAGGSIAQLTLAQGAEAGLDAAGAGASSAQRQPSSAQVTLRVPASQLPQIQKSVAAMGDVLSQSAQASDVGQQHVDLAARVANLRAEETRLRTMLGSAKNVEEMLAVESELARVQGDIESMQAQLTYLERQAAQATLTLNLLEPGALVRPASAGWGLGSAVTAGVQAAAGIVRTMIAGTIALSPLAVVVLLAWAVRRLARRRRTGGSEPISPEPA